VATIDRSKNGHRRRKWRTELNEAGRQSGQPASAAAITHPRLDEISAQNRDSDAGADAPAHLTVRGHYEIGWTAGDSFSSPIGIRQGNRGNTRVDDRRCRRPRPTSLSRRLRWRTDEVNGPASTTSTTTIHFDIVIILYSSSEIRVFLLARWLMRVSPPPPASPPRLLRLARSIPFHLAASEILRQKRKTIIKTKNKAARTGTKGAERERGAWKWGKSGSLR